MTSLAKLVLLVVFLVTAAALAVSDANAADWFCCADIKSAPSKRTLIVLAPGGVYETFTKRELCLWLY